MKIFQTAGGEGPPKLSCSLRPSGFLELEIVGSLSHSQESKVALDQGLPSFEHTVESLTS